jgi:hypothetical protein
MAMKRSIAIILGALLLDPGMTLAGPQCFQVFNGVYVKFNQPVTTTSTAQNGRIWGSLQGCAGLASWPVVGSSHHSKKDGLVLAYRAFTVDANNCGAVDVIGTLKGKPLSGPFQLYNQRTNFGTTGTLDPGQLPDPARERNAACRGRRAGERGEVSGVGCSRLCC